LALTVGGTLPEVGLPVASLVQLFLDAPPGLELAVRERMGNEEALRFLASVRPQEIELRRRLDALGDAAQSERMRQRDDRLRDRFVVAVLVETVDEALVDLHALDRQAGEIGKARVAGAEVVDGDRHAHLLQFEKRRHRPFGMRDDDAFGDLEIEMTGRETAARQRLLDDRQPALVLQLLYGQIDREAQRHVVSVPLDYLPAGIAQHARAQRLDHSGFLGHRYEFIRADDAALGIAPAQQRLDGARAARLLLDLRLIEEKELVVHQAAAHVGLELQPQLDARI